MLVFALIDLPRFRRVVFSALCISLTSTCAGSSDAEDVPSTLNAPPKIRTEETPVDLWEETLQRQHGASICIRWNERTEFQAEFTNSISATASLFEETRKGDLHNERTCGDFVRVAMLRTETIKSIQSHFAEIGMSVSILGPIDPFYFPAEIESWFKATNFLEERNWRFSFYLSAKAKPNFGQNQEMTNTLATIRMSEIAHFDKGIACDFHPLSNFVGHGPREQTFSETAQHVPDGSEDWPNWRRFRHDGLGMTAYSELVDLNRNESSWRFFVKNDSANTEGVSCVFYSDGKDSLLCGMSADGKSFVGKILDWNERWLIFGERGHRSFFFDSSVVCHADLRFVSNDASVLAGLALTTVGLHEPILVLKNKAVVLDRIKLPDALFFPSNISSLSPDGDRVSLLGYHSELGKTVLSLPTKVFDEFLIPDKMESELKNWKGKQPHVVR